MIKKKKRQVIFTQFPLKKKQTVGCKPGHHGMSHSCEFRDENV